MEKVLYLKMINGDDLVASLLREDEEHFIITRPLAIRTIITPGSNIAMSGFYSWTPIRQLLFSEFSIKKTFVLVNLDAPLEVILAYASFFSDEKSDDPIDTKLAESESEDESDPEEDIMYSDEELDMMNTPTSIRTIH